MYRHSFWPSYKTTIGMSCRQVFDGKPICVIGEYAVRLVQFFFMVLIWKAMDRQGADLGGFEIDQLITYSLMGSVLYQQLNIVTPATSSLWEGTIIGRYMRPMPVLGSFAAETVGRWWIPVFMFYSLPLWLGVGMAPGKLIGFQIFWNLVLWIAAILIFHKSEEEMISYGG